MNFILECALKSPANNIAKRFSVLTFEYRFSKFDKKSSNSGTVWLKEGLRYNTVKIFFSTKF